VISIGELNDIHTTQIIIAIDIEMHHSCLGEFMNDLEPVTSSFSSLLYARRKLNVLSLFTFLGLLACGPREAPTASTLKSGQTSFPQRDDESNTPKGDLDMSSCCAQCISASSADPAQLNIAIVDCAAFNGKRDKRERVNETCVASFEQNHMTVGDCRKQTANAPR
jgi:hypothetical protein